MSLATHLPRSLIRTRARTRARALARTLVLAIIGLAVGLSAMAGAAAQTYPPAIDFSSIFATRFFENGRIAFGDVDVVFAPPPPADASVSIRRAGGPVIAQFSYFPDYVFADKAFARMRVRGPADVDLPGPGDYLIEFTIRGKVATRFPFSLRAAGGGKDPFDTTRKFHYDGPWRTLGYLTLRPYKETQLVDVEFWVGDPDLPPGRTQDRTVAKLLRDGRLIGHSRLAQGHVAAGPQKASSHAFHAPHDARQAHAAPPITLREFMVDGAHEIRIERQSDQKLLRSFAFTIAGGRITPIARATLGYQPAVDFVAPRIFARNSGQYQFKEAIWLADTRPTAAR